MSRRKKAEEPFDEARVSALWAKQVELDMSTTAFCAAEGLDARTYNRWKGRLIGLNSGRLKREPTSRSTRRPTAEPPPAPQPTPSAPELVEVTALLASSRPDAGVEVILGDGIRLRLAAGFDPDTLRRAVEALR